jgi:N-acylneuraminate cytidylyltransferase/CMP-N,N'-diacetyllegionaminic acid synthase
LIPARGGSKSIPEKNIAQVGGKPLIAWTILAACAAPGIERVVVSTDSPRIAQVAAEYGAEVPFLRPAELAQDDTPSMDVLVHALFWLEQEQAYLPDYVALLQPTSPLRTATDISTAIRLAREKNASCVIGVCPVSQHPFWMQTISQDGLLLPYLQTEKITRRQDLPSLFVPNGAIYLAQREWILEKRSFYSDQIYAYVMPPERSIDIDEPWELKLVDLILQNQDNWS